VDKTQFVVIDFVVEPHPDKFVVKTGVTVDKDGLSWDELIERVVDRVSAMLVKSLRSSEKQPVSTKVELVGEVDNKYSRLASMILHNPTTEQVMRIEDFLRPYAPEDTGRAFTEDIQPMITVKVKDHEGRFLNFQATDLILSGPKGGNWKPFTQWYSATKTLVLPLR